MASKIGGRWAPNSYGSLAHRLGGVWETGRWEMGVWPLKQVGDERLAPKAGGRWETGP